MVPGVRSDRDDQRFASPQAGRWRPVSLALAALLVLATLLTAAASPASPGTGARPTAALVAEGPGGAADAPWLAGPAPGANLTAAWETTRGDPGTVVAVIDSGVERSHEDLPRVKPGWDAVNDDDTPEDTCGHGTKVAGILGAAQANGIGAVGTANVTILPVKVLEQGPDGCSGSTDDLADAIAWAADAGADVIALPLGCPAPCGDRAVADAAEDATRAGSLVVASAGNTPDEGLYFPASLPDVLAVGALDEDGTPRHGAFPAAGPDLLAPGDGLRTTTVDDGYGRLSGASAAVPVAAGVAALVLAERDRAPDDLARVLRASATDLGAAPAVQGHGALDAGAALEAADEAPAEDRPDGPAPSTREPRLAAVARPVSLGSG